MAVDRKGTRISLVIGFPNEVAWKKNQYSSLVLGMIKLTPSYFRTIPRTTDFHKCEKRKKNHMWKIDRNVLVYSTLVKFIFPRFTKVKLTIQNSLYLRYTTWWFDIWIHCEIIAIMELINIAINSHSNHLLFYILIGSI